MFKEGTNIFGFAGVVKGKIQRPGSPIKGPIKEEKPLSDEGAMSGFIEQ
jgi:hypothetical protein